MDRANWEPQGTDEDREFGRLNALSDGVFAIAITLLVLNIEVPDVPPSRVAQELPTQLIGLVPDLLSYLISFLVIGAYWMAHRAVFRSIRSLDRKLIWLNTLFLMFVAFLPFPTALLDKYPGDRLTVAIYAGSLAIARLPLTAIWWYATRDRRLVHDNIDPSEIRLHRIRGLGIPLIFLLSIGISFISIRAAMFSWVFLFVIDSLILREVRSG